MNRREFLAFAALAAAWPGAQARAGKAAARAPGRNRSSAPAIPGTAVWAYNGSVPGPVLRYRQGERLRIEVENALPCRHHGAFPRHPPAQRHGRRA